MLTSVILIQDVAQHCIDVRNVTNLNYKIFKKCIIYLLHAIIYFIQKKAFII